jgi:hypothetical protein
MPSASLFTAPEKAALVTGRQSWAQSGRAEDKREKVAQQAPPMSRYEVVWCFRRDARGEVAEEEEEDGELGSWMMTRCGSAELEAADWDRAAERACRLVSRTGRGGRIEYAANESRAYWTRGVESGRRTGFVTRRDMAPSGSESWANSS